MSTIQHSATDIHLAMQHFTKLVHLPVILRRANIHKTRGIGVPILFEWLITTIFARYSISRAQRNPKFTKKTVRNCLNDSHTNWQKLVILLAIYLIQYVEHFTDARRAQAFILDDSLFKREFSKKTELLSKVFDHDKQKFYRGFRGLTLGWSDGNTFLPVNFALMSSNNSKNRFNQLKHFDCRSLAAKRRFQAQRKMNDVALELIDEALKAGLKTKYVLFDSWFSSPRMFFELLQRGQFGIGMLKRSKKSIFSLSWSSNGC